MAFHYLKIALRTLKRHMLYAGINVVGLALGISCCLLILLFLVQELSYDRFHHNAPSLYRVLTASRQLDGDVQVMAFVPMPLVPALKAEYPEIARATRFSTGGAIVACGKKAFSETVVFTDPDALEMFDITFLAGDPSSCLKDPSDIVISEAIAEKYFGRDSPIGKTLSMRTRADVQDYTVKGVIAPMPAASSLQFDLLANITRHSMYSRSGDQWSWSNGSAFVQLAPGAPSEDLERKLPGFVQRHFNHDLENRRRDGNLSKDPDAFRLELQPITAIHLDTRVSSSPEKLGNPTYLLILGGIGLLVLTIACINFVTLTIGRSASRAREVGVRKVLGAVRKQLMGQFLGEAFLLCMMALALALGLTEILLPAVNGLFALRLSLSPADGGYLLSGIAGLLLLAGVLAGAYPSMLLSRFQIAEVLRRTFKVGGKNHFSRALVVFQFALSIFLASLALVLSSQIRFLISSSLGYHPEQVVVIPMHEGKPDAAARLVERFRSAAAGIPAVLNVSGTSGAFTHGYDINSFPYKGQLRSTYVYRVDDAYLATLGIPLKFGRNFRKGSVDDEEHAIIVNEAFLRSMGWSEPGLGERFTGTNDELLAKLSVIGVVPDFHFTSLRDEIEPMMMVANPTWTLDELLVRIAPTDIPQTIDKLRQLFNEVAPATPFDLTFLDEDVQRQYDTEMQWGQIVNAASMLAIALACLGLFGLATIAVTNRTKEIGIRKVLGATGSQVMLLVAQDFAKLVALGALLAWPMAYWAAGQYLEHYASRIALSPWIFLASGALGLLVAFLAIAGQILRAVRANPVEALRYE